MWRGGQGHRERSWQYFDAPGREPAVPLRVQSWQKTDEREMKWQPSLGRPGTQAEAIKSVSFISNASGYGRLHIQAWEGLGVRARWAQEHQDLSTWLWQGQAGGAAGRRAWCWWPPGDLLTFTIDGKNHCTTSLRLKDYWEIFLFFGHNFNNIRLNSNK